jgi:hypothetical protein
MVASAKTTKEQIVALLEELPEKALPEVISFLEYQRFKARADAEAAADLPTISLEGLSTGAGITEEEISELRREMWGGLEDRFARRSRRDTSSTPTRWSGTSTAIPDSRPRHERSCEPLRAAKAESTSA